MVVDMHVAVQMTGLWFRQCKNCSVPQLRCPVKVVDVLAVAVHRQGVDVPVILQGPEIPWCSSGMGVDLPVGVSTTGYGSDSTENCGVLHVQYSDKVVDVPAVQFIDVGGPCEHAATQDVKRDAFFVIFGFLW